MIAGILINVSAELSVAKELELSVPEFDESARKLIDAAIVAT